MLVAFGTGVLLGGFVAAQVGPVSLLCIRTSTRSGFCAGVAVGMGAAIVDLLYALCGVAGAAALVQVEPIRIALGFAGAVVLSVMGWRTLRTAWRLRLGGESEVEVATPANALRTGIIATASNPLTIVSWAAIFGAAATASLVATPHGAVALLAGVGIGSATWFLGLAAVASSVGSRLGPRALGAIDVVAGVGLLSFAALLGVRTVRDS
jgi:threonine/homoserine/homoserine lactone efflux protein